MLWEERYLKEAGQLTRNVTKAIAETAGVPSNIADSLGAAASEGVDALRGGSGASQAIQTGLKTLKQKADEEHGGIGKMLVKTVGETPALRDTFNKGVSKVLQKAPVLTKLLP